MTTYVVTIPGDEAVWEARTDAESLAVGERHRGFVEMLRGRGHVVTVGVELTAREEARVVRRSDRGYAVTDGPYAEAVEQAGGLYVVECDVLDDLLEACGYLTAEEPVVEIRPCVDHGGT